MDIKIIREIYSNFLIVLKFVENKNKRKYFFLQFHIILSSIIETLSIFSIIPIIETINNSTNSKIVLFLNNFIETKFLSTVYLILFFCLLLSLSNLYLIYIKKKIIDFGYTLMLDIQKKLFKKLIHNKYEFFINKDISYFNNLILFETQRVKGGFIESSLFILSQILLVSFTFIGLLIYDFKVTIAIIVVLIIFYLIYLSLVSKKLLISSRLNTKFKKDTIQYLNDIFSVIKTLVFKKNKNKIYEKLENILIQNYKINRFEQVIGSIIKNSFEVYFLIIIFFLILILRNNFQTEVFLSYSVFAFAAYKVIPSFHLIYANLISFLASSNPLKLISIELDKKNLYLENYKKILDINKIELKNVSFSYGQNIKVLENLNYKSDKNQVVGICGKSGSGKTTFIDLLSGLIVPKKGDILINDKYFQNYNEILISNSSYCSQKTILIDDTIENNICLSSNEKIDNELLLKAIKIAELQDFINNCVDGLKTVIGENGIRVSGGEAQRINIARTIYLNRQFVFFDESFNNLDMVTSKKVLQNLTKLENSKKIFFITHDLRLLSDFQEILIFDRGKIVEKASYSELQKSSKLFLELLQNEK